MFEQVRGRDAAALAAFQAVEPLARQIASPQYLLSRARAQQVHSLVRLGQAERAGQLLDGLSEQDRDHPDVRIAAAALRLAEDNPGAALTELAPVLDDPVPDIAGFRVVTAYALEAAARDGLGDRAAAESALERALDLAEPDGVLLPFLLSPVRALLDRHPPHRTAHASLIAEIRSLLAGARLVPRPSVPGPLAEPPSTWARRAGNAERIVGPSRPRTRIWYSCAWDSRCSPVTGAPRVSRRQAATYARGG
ncbi:MAG: hypothetical protein ACRDPY_39340 [Streptosporangiaceae bacterium]